MNQGPGGSDCKQRKPPSAKVSKLPVTVALAFTTSIYC
jgi:hypothetical protein